MDHRAHDVAGWPDAAIAEIADRRHSIVARTQLLELGIAASAIDRARRRGRLHRIHHGVYSLLLRRARPALAVQQAALLACGSTAVLSHHTAAALHGLRLPDQVRAAPTHVTVIDADRRHTGLVIHATIELHPQERVLRVQGLATTSVARTLIDLAPLLTDARLEPLADQALRRISTTKLTEALERHPRRPGTPRLRALLHPDRPSADTWSRAEARLLAAIRRAGLPSPEANVALDSYVPDLLWREQQVAVEYDSEEIHLRRVAFHADRTRHNDLTTRGRLQVLHITHRHITETPKQVIVWIVLALVRGGYGS
jgi:hypothetical protein